MTEQSKLIPILREGVNIIKMIFFKELKSHLGQTYSSKKDLDTTRLCGAIINDLFGTSHDENQFKAFSEAHKSIIEKELDGLNKNFPKLQIPLTDALRIQFLCDSLEGINNEAALFKAKEKGILIVDRDVPLPKNFITLAKKLGVSHHILSPQSLKIH